MNRYIDYSTWVPTTTTTASYSTNNAWSWRPAYQSYTIKAMPDVKIEEDELLDVLKEGDNDRNSC